MDRRRALQLATAALLLALTSAGAGAADQKMVFKASDVHPEGYPTVQAVENMGKKLEAATGGRVLRQMYVSLELGGEKGAIGQAQIVAFSLAPVNAGVVAGAKTTPQSFVFDNHYQVAKYYTLTEHLIVPEILVFSRATWDSLSKDDQALIKKLAREAQLDERQLWKKVEDEAMAKMKASGIEVDTVSDKAPFEAAVKPVWDKYGAKYSELIKRIQAVN